MFFKDSQYRWETERANRVRKFSGDIAARRAQRMMAAGLRLERDRLGIAESGFHERSLPRWSKRCIQKPEKWSTRQAMRFVGMPIAWFFIVLFAGLMLTIRYGSYWVGWQFVAPRKRLKVWPYAALSAVAALIGVIIHLSGGLGGGLTSFVGTYVWVQVVLGLALGGWHVFVCGWGVVTDRMVAQQQKARAERYEPKFEDFENHKYEPPDLVKPQRKTKLQYEDDYADDFESVYDEEPLFEDEEPDYFDDKGDVE